MNSDDENDEHQLFGGKDGSVLLIDISPPMWKSVEEEPISIVLSCCISLMKKYMINSPQRLVGVSLFGSNNDDNQGIKNVVQLMPLKEPSVEDIKYLKSFAENPDEICKIWGSTDDFSLADAFWQASRMFSNCSKKMSSQTVTLLSSLSAPKPHDHKAILKRVLDVRDLNIKINIVNVSEEAIPPDSFYMELGKVIADPPNSDWEPPEPVMDAVDIFSLIFSNNHPKAAAAKLKMFLGPNVALGVGLYCLNKPKNPPKKHNLHRDTNELVVSSSTITTAKDEVDEDSPSAYVGVKPESAPLLKSDLIYYVNYGDKCIEFTSEEIRQIRNFAGAPSIKLLGFKSSSVLNMSEFYYKSSAFLYPDDISVNGSSNLFLTLRDRCLALNRVAICLLVARRFSEPRFVALVPQKRVMNGSFQVHPDGFHVVYLPYADEFKEVPLEDMVEATPEQTECLEKIINKLKFHLSWDKFESPTLQKLYRAIEALALEESDPDEIDDTTLPDIDEQDNRLGSLSNDFKMLFGDMTISPVKKTSSSRSCKNTSGDVNAELVYSHLTNGSIDKYTITELKQIFKHFEIPTGNLSGLKKAQLVQMVYDNSGIILARKAK